MRCRYRENKFLYGQYLEVNVYPVYESVRTATRKKKRTPSRPVQERLNQLNAERTLARLIPANFTEDDYYITLTFDPAHTVTSFSEARKELANFVKRLTRARSRAGLDKGKYIYSMEQGSRSGRIHIHMILTGGMMPKELAKIWGRGYIDCKPLILDDTGARSLAKYLCKEKVGDNGTAHAKRYQCSRNCIHPQPKNNDHRYSKKQALSIASNPDDRREAEKMYPGWSCSEIREFFNDVDGHVYFTMLFRKIEPVKKRTG